MRIKIIIGKITVFAKLNDSRTAKWIWHSLPITSKAELWGEEVYFSIEPKIGIEKGCAHDTIEPGDLAYWPQGPSMCLFFGKVKPASTVNVFGKIEGDLSVLAAAKEGELVKVDRA